MRNQLQSQHRKKSRTKVYSLLLTAAFLIPLFVFCVISLTDQDKTVSEAENRNLKTFPACTAESFFSGQFFKDIEEYYSDTFPLRDFFMSASRTIKSAMGFSGNTQLITTQAGSDLGSGENLFETEGGQEATPTPSESAPVPDQQNAQESDIVKTKSIIMIDDFAMEMYSNAVESNKTYAQEVSRLKAALGDGVTVYNLVAPTSIEFYSPPSYHEGSHSQKEGIQTIYDNLVGVIPVDAYSELQMHTDEYLYFRTDHHWTARGAYHGYVAFSKVAGFEPVPLEWMGRGEIPGFVGSMYRFTQRAELKNNPDTVEYFTPVGENESYAYKDASLQNGTPIQVLYTNMTGNNAYLCFYGGDSAIIKTTTSNKNGRKILVTKESYANAFVPFLLAHYEEVYIVDPRRVSMNLPQFVQENGIGEVLVLNYSFATSNPTFMKGFRAMIP